MAKKDKKDKKNNAVSSGEIARNKKALFNYEVIDFTWHRSKVS